MSYVIVGIAGVLVIAATWIGITLLTVRAAGWGESRKRRSVTADLTQKPRHEEFDSYQEYCRAAIQWERKYGRVRVV